MPAIKKVPKEAIIDAAVDVLREDGAAAINARSVARKLGCSTQPIYLSFQNMAELKAAVTRRAIALHTQYVKESLRSRDDSSSCYGQHSRYSSYGFGFVKFAAQEKHLFRWLYLDEYVYSEEIAQKLHRDMTYYSYGLAILASTDHLDLTDEELLAAFRREFTALAAYYGVSQCQR